MPKKSRVFLDTSAILAGLNSPSGAAGAILAACFANRILAVVSSQVIEEANRNIPTKFPHLTTPWQSFLLIPPQITKDPSMKQGIVAFELLPTSDAPILAAAIASNVSTLVTWNTRDFLRKSVTDAVEFPILTPGDFLRRFPI